MLNILVTREVPIKTTIGLHFVHARMAIIFLKITSVGYNIGKLESSHVAGENVKWCSFCGKYGGSSKSETQNYQMTQHS